MSVWCCFPTLLLLLLGLPAGAAPTASHLSAAAFTTLDSVCLRPFFASNMAPSHICSLRQGQSRGFPPACFRKLATMRLFHKKQNDQGEEERCIAENYNASSAVAASTLEQDNDNEKTSRGFWKFPFLHETTKQRPFTTTTTIFQSLVFQDRLLWMGDIATIFVACQLMGLADVLSNVDFWSHGGFWQPVTIPTTLGTLMQRTTFGIVAWTALSLKNGAYGEDSRYAFARGNDDANNNNDNDNDDHDHEQVQLLLLSTLHTLIDYYCLLVMSALWTANFVTHGPVDVMDLLRQCWFLAILMSAFRMAYARWFYSVP